MSTPNRRTLLLATTAALLLPSRLRGDGLSGSITPQSGGGIGNLFDGGISSKSSSGPPVPPPAQAYGLTTSLFADDFTTTSTIDMANTGAPGFNWYLKQAWPHIVDTGAFPWSYWQSAAATSPGVISQSGSVVTLASDNVGNDVVLSTACSNGTGYVGSVFGAQSLYYEFSMAFDPTLSNDSGTPPQSVRDPIGWTVGINFATGLATTYTELDICECGSTVADVIHPYFALHDWTTTASTASSTVNPNYNSFSGSPTYTNQNVFGALVLLPADNGGVGVVKFFLNNVYLPAQDVQFAATGQFSALQTQKAFMIISAGLSWPVHYDFFRIWGGTVRLPAPTVSGLSPTSGVLAGGTAVTISGNAFTGATAVHFGAASASFSVTSDNTIAVASTPAGTGIVDVTVTTPQGTSVTSAADQFTYQIATTTFDPANLGTNVSLSNGNVTATISTNTASYVGARSVVSHSTGKYYAEVAFTDSGVNLPGNYNVGVQNSSESMSGYLGFTVDSNSGGVFGDSGIFYVNSVAQGTGAGTWGAAPVISVAFDAGAELFWFSLNGGLWNNSATANPDTGVGGFSVSGVGGPYFFAARLNGSSAGSTALTATVNFGASTYTYKAGFGNVTTFGNW